MIQDVYFLEVVAKSALLNHYCLVVILTMHCLNMLLLHLLHYLRYMNSLNLKIIESFSEY